MPGLVSVRNWLNTESFTVMPSPSGSIDPTYPAANAFDGLTWSRARSLPGTSLDIALDFGSARAPTIVGFAEYAATRVRYMTSTDGVSWQTRIDIDTSAYNPDVGRTIIRTSPSPTTWDFRYHRFILNWSGNIPEAAVLWLSDDNRVTVDGPSPTFKSPQHGVNNELMQNFGGGGTLLGSSVLRRGRVVSFDVQRVSWSRLSPLNATASEAEGVLARELREGRPFMYLWNTALETTQGEAVYAWPTAMPDVGLDSHNLGSIRVTASGV